MDSLKFCHKLNGGEDTTRFSRAIVGHFQLMNAKTPMAWQLGTLTAPYVAFIKL